MSAVKCGGQASPEYPGKWEEVANNTHRLRVEGGWLYKVASGYIGDPALCFVPDRVQSKTLDDLNREHRERGKEIPSDRVRPEPVVVQATTVGSAEPVTSFCGWCVSPIQCKEAGRCVPGREPIPPGMSCGGVKEDNRCIHGVGTDRPCGECGPGGMPC